MLEMLLYVRHASYCLLSGYFVGLHSVNIESPELEFKRFMWKRCGV